MRFILFINLAIPCLSWANIDSLKNQTKDSVTISIAPYWNRNVKSIPNYLVTVNSSNTSLLKFSSGIDVANSLRGYYPGLALPPYAGNSANPNQMIIDGVAIGESLSDYLTLNGFDYSSITATRSGNALTLIDQATSNGGLLLTSKNGRGYTKPTFEFNSFNLSGFGESRPFSTPGSVPAIQKVNDFNSSNSVAYSQDFGKLDARVSYNFFINHNSLANDRFTSYQAPKLHRMKANVGMDITPKLNVRLILDGALQQQANSKLNYYQTNLSTSYKLFRSFELTGQFFWGTPYSRSRFAFNQNITINESQYKLLNPTLALKYNRNIGQNISINSAVGYAIRKISNSLKQISTSWPASSEQSLNSHSYFANSLFGYKNRLFLDVTWRNTTYSSMPKGNNSKNNYSASASYFILKESNSRLVSFLKVRASTGQCFTNPFFSYPYLQITGNASNKPNSKNKNELGIDLSLLDSRLNFTFNYFNSATGDNDFTVIPSNGYYSILNQGQLKTGAYEAVTDFSWQSKSDFHLNTRLVWAKYTTKIYLPGSSGSGGGGLGSSIPDWVGSFWNMLSWKKFSALLIVETSQGGNQISFTSGNLEVFDASWVKLRDISIGYSLPNMFNRSKADWFVSVSGRNLVSSIASARDPEIANTLNSSIFSGNIQKSVSLNISLTF